MNSPRSALKSWQVVLLVAVAVLAGLAVLKWSLKLLGSLLMLAVAGAALWFAISALRRRGGDE